MTPRKSHVIADKTNDLMSWQTVITAPSGEAQAISPIYPEDKSARTVFSVVKDGVCVREAILGDAMTPQAARAPQPSKQDWFKLAMRYAQDGVFHILSGPDHILFLIGLLLLGGSAGSLLRIVTAFTIAHSITFSLAATGTFCPSPRLIEPLIALSIVAIAVENLRCCRQKTQNRQAGDFRPYLAFAFGLIHGFGFAGALTETGLPYNEIWLPLASFNGGIEIGQACVVLITAPFLAWLARSRPNASHKLVTAGSACIAVIGSVWCIERLLSP